MLFWNSVPKNNKLQNNSLFQFWWNFNDIYFLKAPLKSLNGSKVAIDETEKPSTTVLVCEYSDVIRIPRNQIRWYYHHYRLNNNLKNFRIVETKDFKRNVTISRLFIDNYKHKDHLGFYRCMFKGLYRRIRVVAKSGQFSMTASNRLVDNNLFNMATSKPSMKSLNLIIFVILIKICQAFK